MTTEVKIHTAQTAILRELLFKPQAGYAELQKCTNLASDHFNFHIARLVELGLVQKVTRGAYALTPQGKEYANKLDTDSNTIERQPKSTVLIAAIRLVAGRQEFLFQERLKHPYFGFWGLPSGKLRWGETILQGAARELLEETGLTANMMYKGVYHEHARQANTNTLLEDKIFHVVLATNPSGNFMESFEGGHNAWMTRAKAQSQPKIFPSFDIELDVALGKHAIIEQTITYPAENF